MEYIDGKEKNGIKYDYTKIRKEFKKLKCPSYVYNPLHIPFDKTKWNIIMSERNRGKTTNLLLLGLVFNKLYGTTVIYMRTKEEMIMKKNIEKLFDAINEFNYPEKLTDGLYNKIVYNSRKWFYAKTDADGKIIEKSDNAICIDLSIDKAEVYKSALALPKADFIIFDEFIEKYYYPTQFLDLTNLLSTLIRSRRSAHIFLSANSIDRNTMWFRELMINDELDDMEQGDTKIITTAKGTHVYVEILGHKDKEARKTQNEITKLYFGFENEKLSAITGDETWAVANFPHTPDKFKILNKKHYLEFNNKLVNMEVCLDTENGVNFINCHYATKTYDDSVIYSMEFNLDKRYRNGFGFTRGDNYIWEKFKRDRFTYADNSVGALIERYYEIARKQKFRN